MDSGRGKYGGQHCTKGIIWMGREDSLRSIACKVTFARARSLGSPALGGAFLEFMDYIMEESSSLSIWLQYQGSLRVAYRKQLFVYVLRWP
jgi:hypothetical protein